MRLEELVNKYYKNLNENDLYIWKYISKNRKECEKLVIDQLAYKCNVSRTTVLRFAKKLSLKGYAELKLYLKMENELESKSIDNVNLVCDTYNRVIKNIREKDCNDIFKLMDKAKVIYLCGFGMVQSSIKKEMKRTFMTAGKFFYDLGGEAEASAAREIASDEDLFIIISVSGRSQFLLELTKKLKVKNIPVLAITKLKDNPLAKISDYNLYISTAILPKINGDMDYESVTSYFILIEILFLKYMEYKNREKEKDNYGY